MRTLIEDVEFLRNVFQWLAGFENGRNVGVVVGVDCDNIITCQSRQTQKMIKN